MERQREGNGRERSPMAVEEEAARGGGGRRGHEYGNHWREVGE